MKVREIRVVLLNILAIFLMLHYMAAFLTPVAEKHSRRLYLHACMQASEESNISYMAGYFFKKRLQLGI